MGGISPSHSNIGYDLDGLYGRLGNGSSYLAAGIDDAGDMARWLERNGCGPFSYSVAEGALWLFRTVQEVDDGLSPAELRRAMEEHGVAGTARVRFAYDGEEDRLDIEGYAWRRQEGRTRSMLFEGTVADGIGREAAETYLPDGIDTGETDIASVLDLLAPAG